MRQTKRSPLPRLPSSLLTLLSSCSLCPSVQFLLRRAQTVTSAPDFEQKNTKTRRDRKVQRCVRYSSHLRVPRFPEKTGPAVEGAFELSYFFLFRSSSNNTRRRNGRPGETPRFCTYGRAEQTPVVVRPGFCFLRVLRPATSRGIRSQFITRSERGRDSSGPDEM